MKVKFCAPPLMPPIVPVLVVVLAPPIAELVTPVPSPDVTIPPDEFRPLSDRVTLGAPVSVG